MVQRRWAESMGSGITRRGQGVAAPPTTPLAMPLSIRPFLSGQQRVSQQISCLHIQKYKGKPLHFISSSLVRRPFESTNTPNSRIKKLTMLNYVKSYKESYCSIPHTLLRFNDTFVMIVCLYFLFSKKKVVLSGTT